MAEAVREMALLPQGAAGYGWERLIDAMIADPFVSQRELAVGFGLKASQIAALLAAEEFQRSYAARVEALVTPQVRTIRLSVEERFRGVTLRTLELLQERLEADPSDQLLLRSLELTTRALGYGSKEPPAASVTNVTNHLTVLGENLVRLLASKRAPNDAAHDASNQSLTGVTYDATAEVI